MSQILSESCPECGAENWYYNGPVDDMTYPDVEALKCYKCSHLWRLYDDGEQEELDENCCEEGRPTPNDAI